MWGNWYGRMGFMSGRKQIERSLCLVVVVLPRVVVGRFAKPVVGMASRSCQILLNARNIQVLYAAESGGRSSCTYLSFQEKRAGNGISKISTGPEGIDDVTVVTAKVFRLVFGITSSDAEVPRTPPAIVKIAYTWWKSLEISPRTIQIREAYMPLEL